MRRGFGIVEILVIIVIVAVLAAMLMPALSRAREEARRVGPRGILNGTETVIPGSLPSTDEELWVIARAPASEQQGEAEEAPGSGALLAAVPGRTGEVPVPLEQTDVSARIDGYIAAVDVAQRFDNPFGVKIEARYVFPLPQNAAVNEFVMTVGERRIRGLIRERQQAEAIYEAARAAGQVASLLTQERPNIFTQKVANIEPGRHIDVWIRYFHTLPYRDGWYEYIFPMVVGPRFNPPGSTDGIGAVGRHSRGASGQGAEVQYLRPGERSGHDIALAVDVNPGVQLQEIECNTHAVSVDRHADGTTRVLLSELDSVPNRDFVLRYRVAGDDPSYGLLAHKDEDGDGYFSLMLYPPRVTGGLKRGPLEMVFVIDCSGSMNGEPIDQAKAAVRCGLRRLQPGDTFQVIRFSVSASRLGSRPLPATSRNVARGVDYVDGLSGGGGTMMIEGIKAALDFPHDPERLRFVTFLTDGYIGNEAEILDAVQQRIGESRIFSFGVGSSTNRYLLERMAKVGRGAVAFLGLNESAADVMDLFMDRISRPALTDIEVDWGGMQVTDLCPAAIPDLFVGRPVILTGRYSGSGTTRITIRGRAGSRLHERTIRAALDREAGAAPALPAVWARAKILALVDRAFIDQDPTVGEEIERLALAYKLLSAYTAFVAVDEESMTAGDHGITVAVPVPEPEGVRYDTTVTE
jgi:Ca-activated chloride channel family protein